MKFPALALGNKLQADLGGSWKPARALSTAMATLAALATLL